MPQTNANGRKCAQCGVELPAAAAAELCPRCLLEAGLAQQTALGPSGTIVLPSPDPGSRGLPRAGERLGHYAIRGLLGAGGMGAVYEAEDLDSSRRIALKVLGHSLNSPEARARFFREGRLAASINHPNSVYVFGTEEIGGTPVIAMELVAGGTLQDRVRTKGPLPVKMAVDCILQIIAGLESAQRIGILHRDIKPSNCFLGEDGTTKIGDFGLSISTAVRTEPALTVTGAFLGTPAFCSPEQLRGDELNARSDMYSVGATLFYLLSGRTPFEAKNVVQLLATVLEKRAPSPREFRPEIPGGLAKAILRCLEKQPGERFKSYDELRQALAPYGATAPSPATLGLRFLAGALDLVMLSALNLFLMRAMGSRNPVELMTLISERSPKTMLVWMLLGLSGGVLYFTLLEGIWGASLGKRLCRLRVVRADDNPPGLLRALVRTAFYLLAPPLPYWLAFGINTKSFLATPVWVQSVLGMSFYVVLGLLFCTVRRRNGFAAVYDLVTGTRVISRMALQARPTLALKELQAPSLENAPTLGPYHLLETLEESPEQKWLLGYDLRLLRKVWLRTLPPHTAPVSESLRTLGRAGRLRWLTGRRSPSENWDAFEALSGQPFLHLVRQPQPWEQVRFWLYDLAEEIGLAEKDGTLPWLALDRVWITDEGRAKFLDFPTPGLAPSSPAPCSTLEGAPPLPPETLNPPQFLARFAKAALEGQPLPKPNSESAINVPLPMHVQTFLKNLAAQLKMANVLDALKPLLQRTATISRGRRIAVVLGCIVVPFIASISSYYGLQVVEQWSRSHPGLVELSQLLQVRTTLNSKWAKWAPQQPHPTDRQFAVYIAAHYREVITNTTLLSSPLAITLIKPDGRRFAEQSLAEYPSPTEDELADAEAGLALYKPNSTIFDVKGAPWMVHLVPVISLLIYVCLPALVAALLFRGGLVLLVAGIVFVGSDGRRASRLRVFWRGLLAWSPLALGFATFLAFHKSFGIGTAAGASWLVAGALTMASLWLPNRGLPDRLARTWPVPR